jgi:hypothetical protein
MKKFNVVLLFIIVLASCKPSEGAIQTAISRTQTALPTLTVTPSKTSEPSQTPTEFPPTPTKTEIPTLTPTFTALPLDIILLQEDFEDNNTDGWYSWTDGMTKRKGPNWTVEQEPDGNHYASAFGHADVEDIWYVNNTSRWTDYAFETRIRFVNAAKLKLFTHADGGHANNVVGLFPEGGIYFAQWKQSVGYTDFGMTFSDLFVPDQWYTITVEILGDTLRLYIDHSLVREEKLPVPLINEKGGIGYEVTGDELDLDDIRVWSLQ